MSITVIKPQELAELSKQGKKIDLIDVRTPVEYREVHVEIARNVPLGSTRSSGRDAGSQRLGQRTAVHHLSFGKPRSTGVREVPQGGLLERGQHRRRHDGVRGSWLAGRPWQEGDLAGAAGANCSRVAGAVWGRPSVLSSIRHFIGLAAFVGAGLIFAGITDTCGMGMILARMPWNQCSPDTAPLAVDEDFES